MAVRYKLNDLHLLSFEKAGEIAKCILPHQVTKLLKWAHDEHRHFSIAFTLYKLKEQWYWPTRTSDVERYCRTCCICQLEGPSKKSTTTQSIIVSGPFAKIGMDYLGPISPTFQATEASYVLVVIDCFSRFVWAKARNVELVLAQIRRWVAAKEPASKYYWGRAVAEIMPHIKWMLAKDSWIYPGRNSEAIMDKVSSRRLGDGTAYADGKTARTKAGSVMAGTTSAC
jgi:hypothetical protein